MYVSSRYVSWGPISWRSTGPGGPASGTTRTSEGGAAGGCFRGRLRNRRAVKTRAAPPSDVRAVPELGPPSPVNLQESAPHESASHEIALPETYVVRLEPLPAAIITTLEEIGS